MNSIPQRFQKATRWADQRAEPLILLAITAAALLLFTANLGGVPLRDWDEGTVAGVAQDLAERPLEQWLYPTLHGEPYFNKPPLMHSLIALSFNAFGVNEWAARLPGALLSALGVPLLYLVGRELWPGRLTALLGSTVYLSLLPVVRHGRLAMLDGASTSFFLVTLLSLLRSRRHPRWGFGVGVGLSLMLLTKGVLGLLLGAIALAFILWDAPRVLRSPYAWVGVLLGLVPAASWYSLQGLRYGSEFWAVHLFDQSLERVWTAVERNQGPPWFYGVELLKLAWPWLLFLPMGLRLAWRDRWRSGGKLLLVWGIGYLGVISLMGTKLPWYVYPLYPPLALLVGVELKRLWENIDGYSAQLQPTVKYRRTLRLGLGLLAVIFWGGSIYFWVTGSSPLLAMSLLGIGLTLTAAQWQLSQRRPLFAPVLLWGLYVSLLAFVVSDQWVWELAEDYPVKPVAALINAHVPPEAKLLTSHPHRRPSLEFYSDRPVRPAAGPRLRRQWPRGAYLLVDQSLLQRPWAPARGVGQAADWVILAPPATNSAIQEK